MARSTHDFEIAGKHYRSTALPAGQALDLLPNLLLLLGADLVKLILADDDAIERALSDENMRVGFLMLLADNAQQVTPSKVARELLSETMLRACDGSWQPIDFDDHFAGDLRLMFEVSVQAAIGSFTRPLPEGSPSPSSPDTRA